MKTVDVDLMEEGDTGEAILPVPHADRDGSERELLQYLSADVEHIDDTDICVDCGTRHAGPCEQAALRAENERLRQGLWDVWAALGHDTDGDTGPGALIAGMGVDGFIAMVLRDAQTWRRESEEDYDNDTSRLEVRAREAEAALARVKAALAVIDEVAYFQISLEKMLTVMMTGPNRAQVPPHWRDAVEARAGLFRGHIEAALPEPEAAG